MCWVLHAQGLRTIGPHVAEAFCEIVKLRNRLARICGAEDFYDYTVKQAEGFSKRCAVSQAETSSRRAVVPWRCIDCCGIKICYKHYAPASL